MKRTTQLFLVIISFLNVCFSQTKTFFVKPFETNSNYSSLEDSNYIVRNTTLHLNKLVLFIPGSFSSAKDYSVFCQYPASIGFDVISLAYPNGVGTAPLGSSSDSLVFNKYRQEICFGTPVSSYVSVDTLNSIYIRTLNLLNYLSVTFPADNWGQYLLTPTSIDWSKIILSGHSQGSGHACYIGKKESVERVLMFSGPNDFSTYFNNSANWLRQSGVTPISKHFFLLHLNDEIVPFYNQFKNNQGLGMFRFDDTTLVDILSPPFANSHALYTKVPAISPHNSTIGANPFFPIVWNYMLTSPLITSVNVLNKNIYGLELFPNPTHSKIVVKLPISVNQIVIFDSMGQVVLIENISNLTELSIDVSHLMNGLYFIKVDRTIEKFIKI